MTAYFKVTVKCDVPHCNTKMQMALGDFVNEPAVGEHLRVFGAAMNSRNWGFKQQYGAYLCICPDHKTEQRK